MTILITGGTGFIGAEVVRMLLAQGEQRPVVFHVSGNRQRLADVADQVEFVRGDLGNFSHILDGVKKTGRARSITWGRYSRSPPMPIPQLPFKPTPWAPFISWKRP